MSVVAPGGGLAACASTRAAAGIHAANVSSMMTSRISRKRNEYRVLEWPGDAAWHACRRTLARAITARQHRTALSNGDPGFMHDQDGSDVGLVQRGCRGAGAVVLA